MTIEKQTLWVASCSSLKGRPDSYDFFIDCGREPFAYCFIKLVAKVASLTVNHWANCIWIILQVNSQAFWKILGFQFFRFRCCHGDYASFEHLSEAAHGMVLVRCNNGLVFLGSEKNLSIILYPMHSELDVFNLGSRTHASNWIDIHFAHWHHKFFAAVYRRRQTEVLFSEGNHVQGDFNRFLVVFFVEIEAPQGNSDEKPW